MPATELAINVDHLRDIGAKAAVIAMGFGDNKKDVREPHEVAARRLAPEIPVYVHPFGHHDRSLHGQRFPRYVLGLEQVYEQNGPIVVFASSAAGGYTLAAALENPDMFAGAALLGSRVNNSTPLDGVRKVSPEYADIVEHVQETWPQVDLDFAQRFLAVRSEGDSTVLWRASYLPGARNRLFPTDDGVLEAEHHHGIKYMLNQGWQTLVNIV